MRTSSEYEAEIDRLAAALDLETKARMSMAEAFARATDDLKAAEEKLKARDAFLVKLRAAMIPADLVWFHKENVCATDAITALLDDPKARGEQALPLDMA